MVAFEKKDVSLPSFLTPFSISDNLSVFVTKTKPSDFERRILLSEKSELLRTEI